MATYEELLTGQQAPPVTQNPNIGFDAMQQPVPEEVVQMMRPPASQEEFEARKVGWMEFAKKVTADPNIMRAVGMFGASLGSARTPGQTRLGHFGQALNVGRSAYDFGTENAYQRELAASKEQREAEESAARVGLTKAQTSTEQARPGLVTAQSAEINARRAAMEAKLQPEIDLLNAQVGQNKSHSELNAALARFNKIRAQLEEEYGAQEAAAKLEGMGADAAYKRALARYQDAHTSLTNAQAAEIQGKPEWQMMGMKLDPETGIGISETYNKRTNERRRVVSTPPQSAADATARAKADVDAVYKSQPGSLIGDTKEQIAALSQLVGEPVKTRVEAVNKLARRYMKGGHYITDIKPDGTVSTREVTPPETPRTPPAEPGVVRGTIRPAPNAPAAAPTPSDLHTQLMANPDYANKTPEEQFAIRQVMSQPNSRATVPRPYQPDSLPGAIPGATPAAAAPPPPPGMPTLDQARAAGWKEGEQRPIYDRKGRLIGTINPDGSMTQNTSTPGATATY